ncbi:MAG TPA: signal recognition particle-docking protein FtsY [Defluviitoga tunisiensis]|nr:signal recognition particle-docking protein FtsY [Defluviitoga tunisiensis]HHV01967.1 signal recognition particle-docking protein FtsY [Defluviitoga tunisiensis]HOB54647.1 signal recognition particle-docking protein FtsY [Defluviitoga tunisiensis]HOK15588.1 signal recognition particle-docking protein FtsY [Defluviitoga tunisiensis]HOL85806.1 signal recognition particle-docking protein FtsY [Defluviitoga tunisiensis]
MSVLDKFMKGLSKTRKTLFHNIKTIFSGRTLDEDTLEELEEILIMSDMGVDVVEKILEELKDKYHNKITDQEDPLLILRDIMVSHLSTSPLILDTSNAPLVVLLVGVNGSGKTTTAAKLAKIYMNYGKDVVLAAADTFRAAAIEQLKEWGNRLNATVIAHQKGSDPAAVVFDAISHAKAKSKDVIIIDTAGRLHTKSNLMDELKKIKRVVQREIEGAPQEILLVLDGTTGQNGIIQAKAFKEAIDITGVAITKLDGTAKGGIAFAINHELNIPIKLVGLGEKEDDLQIFDPVKYCNALLGIEE